MGCGGVRAGTLGSDGLTLGERSGWASLQRALGMLVMRVGAIVRVTGSAMRYVQAKERD